MKIKYNTPPQLKGVITFILIFLLTILQQAEAQRVLTTPLQKQTLRAFSDSLRSAYTRSRQKALLVADRNGWITRKRAGNGGVISLQGINKRGFPVFLKTYNTNAAATTRTNAVQPGGELGLNLSGASSILKNKLAIWDGGTIYTQHVEFADKNITVAPNQVDAVTHSTHVAGTMIAKG